MYGAIIGDLAGSEFEYNQVKRITSIEIKNNLIKQESFYSDDSILTIAILDAILNDKNYEFYLKKYGSEYIKYKPGIKPYFETSFSPRFIKWINGNSLGKSTGNGAMMRISPIGYLFDNEKDIINNVKMATIPSHNSQEAIECSTIIALIIFYARKGLTKEQILEKMNIKLEYKLFDKFNVTCLETIDNCLYALFNSSSFEDSIKKVISYGGDTDTNACIVGSMAEVIYGIDKNSIEEANKKIPQSFIKILQLGYKKMRK